MVAVRVPKVEDEARLGADAVLDGGLRVEGDAHGAALAAVSHARRVSQRGDGDDLAGAAVLPRPGHLKAMQVNMVYAYTLTLRHVHVGFPPSSMI